MFVPNFFSLYYYYVIIKGRKILPLNFFILNPFKIKSSKKLLEKILITLLEKTR